MTFSADFHNASNVLPSVRLRRSDTVQLEPVPWLWRGFLPLGMLTILGGAPGCGKTTIAVSFAATVSSGGQWPDGSRCTEAGDVIIWNAEDPNSITAARLAAAGADMTRVHLIDGISGGDDKREGSAVFDPARDVELLEEAMMKLPAPRLLILDPIGAAVGGDSHKGAEVRRALQPVVDLAQTLGCAVLGITHFSKGTAGRDPVERVTGSIAFAALARMVLVAAKVKAELGQEGEPRRMLLRAKSNIGPDEGGFAYELQRIELAPNVEGQRAIWLQELDGTARELLASAEAEPANDSDSGPGDAAQWLREVLAQGPIPARDVKRLAYDAGYYWRTVQRAMKRAGVQSSPRIGFGQPTLWSIRSGAANLSRRPKVDAVAPQQASCDTEDADDADGVEVF